MVLVKNRSTYKDDLTDTWTSAPRHLDLECTMLGIFCCYTFTASNNVRNDKILVYLSFMTAFSISRCTKNHVLTKV